MDTFYKQTKSNQKSIIRFLEGLNDLEYTESHTVSKEEHTKCKKERKKLIKKYKKYIKNN